METTHVTYGDNLRTEATHLLSGETIFTDAPPDNEGLGQSFSPTDLLATALASCMLTIMGIQARNRKISIEGTKAEVTKIMSSSPRRVGSVKIKLTLPHSNYTDKDKIALKNAAIHCPVAQSLNAELIQEVELVYPDQAAI